MMLAQGGMLSGPKIRYLGAGLWRTVGGVAESIIARGGNGGFADIVSILLTWGVLLLCLAL